MSNNLRKWLYNLIIFLAGVIATKVIQTIMAESDFLKISDSDFLNYAFPTAILLLILLIFFYIGMTIADWRDVASKLGSMLGQVGSLVTYDEKSGIFGEDRAVPFYDPVHSPLVKAEKELLIFTDSTIKTTTGGKGEKSRREKYLKAIERNAKTKAKDGFKYIRITQYPEGTETPQSSKITRDHWMRMLQLKEENKKHEDFQVEVMKVESSRSFSFMIIDNRILEFEVVGYHINEKGETIKYVLGYFTITDASGKLIGKFRKFFDQMVAKAVPVSSDDLKYVATNPEDKSG